MKLHFIILTLCVLLVVVGSSAGAVMAAKGQDTPHPQATSAPGNDCVSKCVGSQAVRNLPMAEREALCRWSCEHPLQ